MARPTKKESLAIRGRDKKIYNMDIRGYPLDYIADFFNLSKGRIVQILNIESGRAKRNKKNV